MFLLLNELNAIKKKQMLKRDKTFIELECIGLMKKILKFFQKRYKEYITYLLY